MVGSICLKNPLFEISLKMHFTKNDKTNGGNLCPVYKPSYTDIGSLVYSVPKLGLFESYLGLRKDMNLK